MGDFIPCHPECRRPRESRVDRVVVHRMEGTLRGTIAWFQMGREARAKGLGVEPDQVQMTAAHFLVGLDGRVVQMAVMTAKVSHAGSPRERGWNDRSIGIEFEGYVANPWPEAQIQAGAELVARMILPLYREILPDRAHILGHSEVPGATHTDPGELFPWDDFLARIRAAQGGAS